MNSADLVGFLRAHTARQRAVQRMEGKMDDESKIRERKLREEAARKANNEAVRATLKKEKANAAPVKKISRQVPKGGDGIYYIDFRIKRLVAFYKRAV
jgi:hypothetical protein